MNSKPRSKFFACLLVILAAWAAVAHPGQVRAQGTATLSGVVTGPDGTTPLPGVQVDALLEEPSGWFAYYSTSTVADGSYALTEMNAGTYRLKFSVSGYAAEFYTDALSVDGAADVVVAEGANVPNINASLALGASISGFVSEADGTTPIPDVFVEVYLQVGAEWIFFNSASTSLAGLYSVGDLPAGNYRVRFYSSSGHATEYYNNVSNATAATPVAVATAAAVININASLAPGGTISGALTWPDGITPLSFAFVTVYAHDGSAWIPVNSAFTFFGGVYSVIGLPAGTYRVGFEYPTLLGEFYNDVDSLTGATDLVVAEGATVSGIDAALGLGGGVVGTVTEADETTGIENAEVTIYALDGGGWVPYRTTQTSSSGFYGFTILPPGTYRVGFSAAGYTSEFYNNVADVSSAADLAVVAGVDLDNVNAALAGGVVPPVVTGLARVGGGSFQLSFTGAAGRNYQLQMSGSLQGWTNLGAPTNCLPGTNNVFIGPAGAREFWRVKEVP